MKKTNAFSTSVVASILGATVILSAGTNAEAGCRIVNSTAEPGAIKIALDTNPLSYPSLGSFYQLLQSNPKLFPAADGGPGKTPIVKAYVYVENFPFEDQVTHETRPVSGFQNMDLRYIPPQQNVVVNGKVSRWALPGFDGQLKRENVTEGLESEVRLTTDGSHRALLKQYMALLPACSDDPNMQPSDDGSGQDPAPEQQSTDSGPTVNEPSSGYQPVSVPGTPVVVRRAAR